MIFSKNTLVLYLLRQNFPHSFQNSKFSWCQPNHGILVNKGFDINKKYFSVGGTILHSIAAGRHWDRSTKNIWKYLLQNGADVNVLNENGYTPLMLSICHNWYLSDELEMAKTLLRYGADRSVRGFDGMTFDSIAMKRKIDISSLAGMGRY